MSKYLYNNSTGYPGIYRGRLFEDGENIRAYIPAIHSESPCNSDGSLKSGYNKNMFPIIQWCAYNIESIDINNVDKLAFIMFENGDAKRPVCISYAVIGGGSESSNESSNGSNQSGITQTGSVKPGIYTNVTLTSSMTAEQFRNADIKQIPFLTEAQILTLLQKSYFGTYSNSRLNVSDKEGLAKQLYNVQTSTGLSVLVSLAICANETGWARSFAGSYYNFWNFGANSSKGEFGHYFDNAGGVAPAFEIFHNEFLRQYYTEGNSTVKANGGPWKSLQEMESTYCPSPAGWATVIGKCAVMLVNFIV